MTSLAAALEYLEAGFSVIPCARDKKPLVPWLEFQKRKAGEDEVRAWFSKNPDANVGIVTGSISDLTVIDCDSQAATESFRAKYRGDTASVKTPKGTHFYFRYKDGIRNMARIWPEIDVRSEGGYVIAPPSINGTGNQYKWVRDYEMGFDSVDALLSLFSFYAYRGVDEREEGVYTGLHSLQPSTELFIEGRRNEDLFTVANALTKGGSEPEFMLEVLRILATSCSPSYPEKEVDGIIRSAMDRAKRRDRNLAEEVEEFVLSTNGIFLSTEVERCLRLSTREEKKNLSIILKRLSTKKPKPMIDKNGTRNGQWIKRDNEIEFVDFKNVSTDSKIDLILPLGIHKKTIFMPKSVIVIAGVTGFGKTTLALNIIRENMDKLDTYYFMSEMGPEGLNKKLSYFNFPIDAWNFKAINSDKWDHTNIQDKIFPDAFNVIDYLEPEGDKPYGIHAPISKIIDRLNKGIALITIQKKPGADLGTGAVYSAKASSLYLSLDWGTIYIWKNRFREEDAHPHLTHIDFDLIPGCNFKEKGGWYNPNLRKKAKKYEEFVDGD